ncbi:gamma-aminobutyric acid type B receptor subunit 2-like, partial [Plectropomus leopardus]|uniref:gamma-aminobutyric acid type B receptor subunit 2-like n=1 Tax=Plectropomus leopardus TaxID=160734 RepID=UPI001C4DBC0D
VRLWTLSVGHTVVITVLFTKSWSVYSLCSGIKQTQQHARLQRSGCLVFWMFLLDAFVLITWQILDPLRRVEQQHSVQRVSADEDVLVRLYSERCSSTSAELWLTAVYGYKAPLLGLGCFVAWSIRSAQEDRPALRSKQLTLSVFTVTAFSVSGASASLLTSHNPPVHFCVTSVLILCCNVLTLSWLFGPKLFLVCWSSSELQQPSELQAEAAEGEEEEEEEEEKMKLSRLNQQLRSQTAQLDVEIETITMQLFESEEADPELKLHHTTGGQINGGDVRSVTWTHAAQVCPEVRNSETKPSSPDGINSPEHVRRRLSVQLPILHHSYLPAIGGVSASSSSLFGSQDLFVYPDDNFPFR